MDQAPRREVLTVLKHREKEALNGTHVRVTMAEANCSVSSMFLKYLFWNGRLEEPRTLRVTNTVLDISTW